MPDKEQQHSYSINSVSTVKGLNTDVSVNMQPKDSYRFALNAINISEKGDTLVLTNELSNRIISSIPSDMIVLNITYMVDNKFILFLVKDDETESEIGILDLDTNSYKTNVNDSNTDELNKLKFKISKPIDATYRLRLGSEHTVYWTDDNTKPKYYNFAKPNEFKDKSGRWTCKKFELIRNYKSFPKFENLNVLNSGGKLNAGTYIVIPQYVDENMNPTEFVYPSKEIYIYNDSTKKDFKDIQASINSDVDYQSFGPTNKAIEIKLSNLDTDYLYYRIAIAEINNGTGKVSKVIYSDIIPTTKLDFIYTGLNGLTLGTIEEVRKINSQISKAKHIVQYDNTLLLGTTTGETSEICKLQKYASKIKADCVTTTVILNDINDPRNPKNPTYKMGDMVTGGGGYMPGEIEAFAIVYAFDDGTFTPGFHIPGRPQTTLDGTIYNTEISSKIYPMSKDNQSKSNVYTDNNSCGGDNFWGLDCDGNTLLGKPVRHHRFPLRSEIGLSLVNEKKASEVQTFKYKKLSFYSNGIIELECTKEMIDAGQCSVLKSVTSFTSTISFRVNGVMYTLQNTIDPNYYKGGDGSVSVMVDSNLFSDDAVIEVVSVTETIDGVNFENVGLNKVSSRGLKYTYSLSNVENHIQDKIYSTEILGINFSNIEKPNIEDSLGKEIVGYFIVKAERTDSEKTIIDSAVILPTIKNKKYIASGLLQPELKDTNVLSDNVYGVISPTAKFNNTDLEDFNTIDQQGNFNITERLKSKIRLNDVLEGSSYNSKFHKDGNDDGHEADGETDSRGLDGWCLKVICRDNITKFINRFKSIDSSKVDKHYSLNALDSRDTNNSANSVFNISADNRVSILETNEKLFDYTTDNLPYVYFRKENLNPYSNFRNLRYHTQSINIEYFNSAKEHTSVFSGDTVITPMRYVNSVFWDNTVAKRVGKSSLFKKFLGVLLIVGGVLAAIFTGGSTLVAVGAGLTLVGAGALSLSAGVKMDNYNKAYLEEYEKGLRETIIDDWVDYEYKKQGGYDGPSDDEIQWAADCISNLWFESQVNMYLRIGMSSDTPTYLSAPAGSETGNTSPENVWEFFGTHYWNSLTRDAISSLEKQMVKKLTRFSEERNASREYVGIALGEYYKLNPDYVNNNQLKYYYTLPLEYDCCSDSNELFVHRWYWSEQSFQEQNSDNYRIFLPNNYRDIDGETGKIINMFVMANSLFIHTEEALYKAIKSYQERVTDEVVSFLGTGSMFEMPPQKLVDDSTGHSSGTKHKYSSIKTNMGYFFIDSKQNKVIQFNGKELKPISNIGESSWFRDNLNIETQQDYKYDTGEDYPFLDNVTNKFGVGFSFGYDSKFSRLLITKKDYTLNIPESDYKLTQYKGNLIIFKNLASRVSAMNLRGFKYKTIESGMMKFEKSDTIKIEQDVRVVNGEEITIPVYSYKDDYEYLEGEIISEPIKYNRSWSKSFSFLSESWISYHSYIPNSYINSPNRLITLNSNSIWEHNVLGDYQTFYNKYSPFIIDVILASGLAEPAYTETVSLNLKTEKFSSEHNEYYSTNDVFFNKVIFYNSRQTSGLQNIDFTDKEDIYDMNDFIDDSLNISAVKINEMWNINNIRDYRVVYDKPIFKSNIESVQDDYFIDKVLNDSTIDYNKDWQQVSLLNDTYLGVRLQFDKFADTKLMFNFSSELRNNG